MSRQKKSRKPAPIGPQKAPRVKKEDRKEPKAKKTKGQKSGSRNNPIVTKSPVKKANKSTDPRHGSKKPIALTPVVEEPVKVPDFKPQVKLSKVKPEGISPELELEQIENDERLMELLDRADAGEVLKGKDAKYFNAKTARHQELIEQLGLDEDYDDEDYDDESYDEDEFDEDFDHSQTSSLIEQWEAQDDDLDDNPESNED